MIKQETSLDSATTITVCGKKALDKAGPRQWTREGRGLADVKAW